MSQTEALASRTEADFRDPEFAHALYDLIIGEIESCRVMAGKSLEAAQTAPDEHLRRQHNAVAHAWNLEADCLTDQLNKIG